MSDQTYVIYHAGCPDGFGAAWAARKHFSRFRQEGQVHYIPASYSEPFPDTAQDSEIYILDLSYPPDVIVDAHIRHHGKVVVLDHHKTAQEALQYKVPNCHFDMEHSGAWMAWRWWFPQSPVPELIRYIQDRDLWEWKLPDSREVSAAIDAHKMDFNIWDRFEIDLLIEQGRIILPYIRNQVDRMADSAVWTTVLGLRAPAVNSSILQSETAERVLELNPAARFAAIYSDKLNPRHPNTIIRRWSLRSRPGPTFDVAKLAQTAGGGGHHNAAGCTEKLQIARI